MGWHVLEAMPRSIWDVPQLPLLLCPPLAISQLWGKNLSEYLNLGKTHGLNVYAPSQINMLGGAFGK